MYYTKVYTILCRLSIGKTKKDGQKYPRAPILYSLRHKKRRPYAFLVILGKNISVKLGRHIDISGAESDPVRRIREKEARTELVTGKSFIWLLDETTFKYAMDRGLLSPLPAELKSHKAATEGFGLLLSELPLAEASGFSDLRPDSILCLRRSPFSETESYGRSGEEYDAAAVCFVNLAKLRPVAGVVEK